MNATASFDPHQFAQFVHESGCISLRRVALALTRLYDDMLAPLGLKATELGMLRICAASGPLSLEQLANELEASEPMIRRGIRELVKRGLVRRQRGPGRGVLLSLTPPGCEALMAGIQRWDDAQRQVISSLGEEGWNRVHRQLAALCDLQA